MDSGLHLFIRDILVIPVPSFIVAGGQTVPRNVGIFRNDSEIAKALGIPSLGAESSTNISLGVTSKISNALTLTVDAYQIDIKNRVVLTGNIARTAGGIVDNLLTAGNIPPDVTSVAFFTNAIDTRTRGIDIVLASSQKIGIGMLDITAGANFNKSEIIGKHLRLPISYLRMLSEKLSLAESKSLEL